MEKSVLLACKLLASVFWDSKGILLVDYQSKGQTINGRHFADLPRHLCENIKIKLRGKLTNCLLFSQYSAPLHSQLSQWLNYMTVALNSWNTLRIYQC